MKKYKKIKFKNGSEIKFFFSGKEKFRPAKDIITLVNVSSGGIYFATRDGKILKPIKTEKRK